MHVKFLTFRVDIYQITAHHSGMDERQLFPHASIASLVNTDEQLPNPVPDEKVSASDQYLHLYCGAQAPPQFSPKFLQLDVCIGNMQSPGNHAVCC